MTNADLHVANLPTIIDVRVQANSHQLIIGLVDCSVLSIK